MKYRLLSNRPIAFFMPNLNSGGAEKVMATIAREFVKKGQKVDFVLGKATGPFLSELPPGVRIFDLNSPRIIRCIPKFIKYLRKRQPKVLISGLSHANLVSIWSKSIARVETKTIICEHSTMVNLIKESSTTKRSLLLPPLMRLFYPLANAIVPVSKGISEELVTNLGLDPQKIHVIYNPVIGNELFERAQQPVMHPWFPPSKIPVLLGVGRLSKAKDFSTLIRAFSLLRSHCPSRLLILGEGEERPVLETLVKSLGLQNEVEMPGFVENPYKYMARSNLFILSSEWEGLPTVLIEALALGIPVVSTDCPTGPSEILEGGRLGRLVRVGDAAGLAKAIRDILENPRDAGFPEMNNFFDCEIAIAKYFELCEKLIKE